MIRTALGMRMHSGWGAMVAASFEGQNLQIADRRCITIADPEIPGSKQPFHAAARLNLSEAEGYIARCYSRSEELAFIALSEVTEHLRKSRHFVTCAALLLASGRPLPELPEVLRSHALIHTAEGEFFRRAFRTACERSNIRIIGFKEAELSDLFQRSFGAITRDLEQMIAKQGKLLGPPWTEDQKRATQAALLALRGEK